MAVEATAAFMSPMKPNENAEIERKTVKNMVSAVRGMQSEAQSMTASMVENKQYVRNVDCVIGDAIQYKALSGRKIWRTSLLRVMAVFPFGFVVT